MTIYIGKYALALASAISAVGKIVLASELSRGQLLLGTDRRGFKDRAVGPKSVRPTIVVELLDRTIVATSRE